MSFKKSLAIGNKGQQILIQLLEASGFKCIESVGKCIGWDVKAITGEQEISFECKNDDYSKKSGNFCFEFYNSQACKPSGITATTADIWIQISPPDEVWAIKSSVLLDYCRNNKPFKTIFGAGDGNADLYLYRKDEVTNYFVRLDELEQENIPGVLYGLLGNSDKKAA